MIAIRDKCYDYDDYDGCDAALDKLTAVYSSQDINWYGEMDAERQSKLKQHHVMAINPVSVNWFYYGCKIMQWIDSKAEGM